MALGLGRRMSGLALRKVAADATDEALETVERTDLAEFGLQVWLPLSSAVSSETSDCSRTRSARFWVRCCELTDGAGGPARARTGLSTEGRGRHQPTRATHRRESRPPSRSRLFTNCAARFTRWPVSLAVLGAGRRIEFGVDRLEEGEFLRVRTREVTVPRRRLLDVEGVSPQIRQGLGERDLEQVGAFLPQVPDLLRVHLALDRMPPLQPDDEKTEKFYSKL